MNVYIKWGFVVSLNSLLGLFLGFSISSGSEKHILGMIVGVTTWSFIYIAFDSYLLRKGLHGASKRLLITALIRACLQFTFYIDFYAGMLALFILDSFNIALYQSLFLYAYCATVLTGFILNLLCGLIYLIVYGVNELKRK